METKRNEFWCLIANGGFGIIGFDWKPIEENSKNEFVAAQNIKRAVQ